MRQIFEGDVWLQTAGRGLRKQAFYLQSGDFVEEIKGGS